MHRHDPRALEVLKDYLKTEGYVHFRFMRCPYFMCAVMPLTFGHAGLFINLNSAGNLGYYNYSSIAEAIMSLDAWNGYLHPPGNWSKFKGKLPKMKKTTHLEISNLNQYHEINNSEEAKRIKKRS